MEKYLKYRDAAYQRFFKDGWFWKLIGSGLLLGLCVNQVESLYNFLSLLCGVDSWSEYALSRVANIVDVTSPVPNLTDAFIVRATIAEIFLMLLMLVLSGIRSYGEAILLLHAVRDQRRGWFPAMFRGFKIPLGLFALSFRLFLIFFGYILLTILFLPLGLPLYVIALYRYRFAWLLKADHPEWTAGECLAESRRIMKGNKMKSFNIDWVFWKPITGALLMWLFSSLCCLFAVFADGALCLTLWTLAFLVFIFSIPVFLVVGHYVSVGQGFFYKELTQRDAVL